MRVSRVFNNVFDTSWAARDTGKLEDEHDVTSRNWA